MSLNRRINYEQCKEWREKSKLKLKEKVLNNIQNRIHVSKLAINNTIDSDKT